MQKITIFIKFYTILLLIFFSVNGFANNIKTTHNSDYTKPNDVILFNILGKKTVYNPKDYNKNSLIITKDDIDSNNYKNVYEVLENTPGITLGKFYKDVIDIRG